MSWLTHAREVTAVSELTLVETLWLAPLLVSASVQTDRLTEVTEVRWLTHAREVMEVSGMTVVRTVRLALLLVSSSCQCDRRKRATGGDLVLQESALVLNDGSVFVYTQMEAISIIHRAKRGRHFHGWKNDPLPRLC